jgi:hypothetical protein
MMVRCRNCGCGFEVEQFGHAKCPNCRGWVEFPERGSPLAEYLGNEGQKLSVQEVKKWIKPRVDKLNDNKRNNLVRKKGDWKTN